MSKVKSIHENQYVISDNTAEHLIGLGFKYDNDEDKHVYTFPVLRYDKMTALRGRITAYTDTNEIQVDVTDNNFTPYAPFYNIECGNYDVVLNKINKVILNEFSKLKITKKYKERISVIMKINLKRLTNTAKIPTRQHEGDAGYDLYADIQEPVTIEPHTTKFIKTGLAIEIPDGYFGAVFAKSGLASKQGLCPANCVGVCDSRYRGEYMVALHNDSTAAKAVSSGDRIAQLVVMPYLNVEFNEVGELSSTERGEGGFGSTGR